MAEAQQGFTCPEAQRVRVELPKWKARVLKASAGSPKLGQALAELRFGSDTASLEGGAFVVCQEPFQVAGVDLFQADLTEAAEKDTVVQVRMRGGEEGVGRSAHYELAYWVAEGATLTKVFSADTYSASYTSPIPPVEERVGKVKLQGGFPKTIVLTEEVLCHPLDEEEKKALGDVPECKPSHKRTEYRWRDGLYLEQ